MHLFVFHTESNEKGQRALLSTLRNQFLLFWGLAAAGLKPAVRALDNCCAEQPSPQLRFQSQGSKIRVSRLFSELRIAGGAVGATLAEAPSLLQQGKEKERNSWQRGPLLLAALRSRSNAL